MNKTKRYIIYLSLMDGLVYMYLWHANNIYYVYHFELVALLKFEFRKSHAVLTMLFITMP